MKKHIGTSERDDLEKVLSQSFEISKLESLRDILSVVSSVVLVLNEKRQVVFANDALIEKYNISATYDVLGFRPGEFMRCKNAKNETGGCGTTEDCRYCGVVNAIVNSRISNEKHTEEARISVQTGSDYVQIDLAVTAKSFLHQGYVYTIYSAEDITEKKQKDLMERVFFHDIINLAGSLDGIMVMLDEMEEHEAEKFLKTAKKISHQLLDEILAHQDLLKAEKDELKVSVEAFVLGEFIEELIDKMKPHRVAKNKRLKIINATIDEGIVADKVLLERVLFNMLKNACEASKEGDVIEISAGHSDNNEVVFKVHNMAFMPKEVQVQMFKRSFSTKGEGRGLGTYSMKLIGEKYLKGKVDFESSKSKGTTFSLTLPISTDM